MILTHDMVIARILRRAAKLRLRVQCKTVNVELGTLSRTTNIHMAPKEWGAWPAQRSVMLEISYGAEHVDASTDDRPGAAKRGVPPIDVVAVFRLVGYEGVPVEQLEERAHSLLETLCAVFGQTLSVDYSVTTNYREPAKVSSATVGVRFEPSLVDRSFDIGFLDQVAEALRKMGPGGRLY